MTVRINLSNGDGLVVVGRVRRAWGVRGQLSVDWSNGSCPVEAGENVYLKAEGQNSFSAFTIAVDHRHGNCNVITLKELSDIADAERYRGSEIRVELEKLPRLGEGEYYTYQLIGMRVETAEGGYLGDIAEIFSTGSNDVYVVRDKTRELLIPAIADVVKVVDVNAGRIVVDLIEGLV